MSKIWKQEKVNMTPKKSGLKRDSDLEIVKKINSIEKIKLTNDGYDMTAKDWDATRQTFWEELVTEIDKVVKGAALRAAPGKENTQNPKIKLLDLGCGNGRLLNILDNNKIEYVGIDPSIGLLNIAKEKYPDHDFKLFDGIDFSALNIEKKYFDTVISIAVLHHIPPEIINTWLTDIYNTTKENSISLFTTWNLENSYYQLDEKGDAVIGFMNYKNTRYVHNYPKQDLKKIFENVGYKVLEIKEISRDSGMSNIVIVVEK
jgi:2-polyprenyl-3-methyl-5-hydroxy-6-metoxy-1,4-benzoquinol methylase